MHLLCEGYHFPMPPAPGALERYALAFDNFLATRTQRAGFRRYVEELILPTERNKPLTGPGVLTRIDAGA
jgi:hypothetical protein